MSLFLCMVLENVLITFFYMWRSSFSSITYWRDCLFSIVYSCLLCCRLIDHRCVGLFLGFLSCSIKLYFCFCASSILVFFCFFFWCCLFWPHHAACRILIPQPGIEPRPCQWQHQVLIAGPPGNSHYHTVLMTLALYYSLQSGSLIPPATFFFLMIALAIWGSFVFPYKLWNFFF